MKLGWTNDLHLDIVCEAEFETFLAGATGIDAAVICGDISTGRQIEKHIELLLSRLTVPKIYFVTGNHDCWHSSVLDIHARMSMLAAKHKDRLFYLPEAAPIRLSVTTALLGENGWGDARWGAGADTNCHINDFRFVDELKKAVRRGGVIQVLRQIADDDAKNLKTQIETAVSSGYKRLIIATHVPPWPGASRYRGEVSSPDDLAFYACKATGDAIIDAVHANPSVDFLVLCGHTHGAADYRPKGIDNLRCLSGGQKPDYGEPKWQEAIDVD